MSANNAATYAASVAQGIRDDASDGFPFGAVDDDHYAVNKMPGEALDAFDYLETVLEVSYIVNSEGEYRGAEVLVTVGGPNAWIDTRSKTLEVSWGTDRASESLPESFCDALGAALEDVWGAR